jgi:adenosylcobinamide kinase/adenosylcobinamide-phosphate guanylyltransferase
MTKTPRLELILGGARSGKSRIAQERAEVSGLSVVYLATATAQDEEMQARIEHHRQSRPASWPVIEEPVRLADTLCATAGPQTCILVDCLTLWLTNLLCHADPQLLSQERDRLLEVLPQLPGRIILVSNETGLGVIPADPLSRRFVDEAGRLHQALAQLSDTVIYSVAGLPQALKGEA